MSSGFDAFIEAIFDQHTNLSRSGNREFVIARSRHVLRLLRAYRPANDDEQINVECFIELFEDLVLKAGGTL